MARLCERPGCSSPADVAYGFDADLLTVWLDALDVAEGSRGGVLCRRHADAMVVPLGWMLDDRREPVPRLFQTRAVEFEPPAPVRKRTRQRPGDDTVQLRLDAIAVEQAIAAADRADRVEQLAIEPEIQPDTEPEIEPEITVADVEESPAWVPHFDPDDDLKGLLKARGSLLSRAFNGTLPKQA